MAGLSLIERRIRTEPERFAGVLRVRPRARILIEAPTDSEWVARCLDPAMVIGPRRCVSPELYSRGTRPR